MTQLIYMDISMVHDIQKKFNDGQNIFRRPSVSVLLAYIAHQQGKIDRMTAQIPTRHPGTEIPPQNPGIPKHLMSTSVDVVGKYMVDALDDKHFEYYIVYVNFEGKWRNAQDYRDMGAPIDWIDCRDLLP